MNKAFFAYSPIDLIYYLCLWASGIVLLLAFLITIQGFLLYYAAAGDEERLRTVRQNWWYSFLALLGSLALGAIAFYIKSRV